MISVFPLVRLYSLFSLFYLFIVINKEKQPFLLKVYYKNRIIRVTFFFPFLYYYIHIHRIPSPSVFYFPSHPSHHFPRNRLKRASRRPSIHLRHGGSPIAARVSSQSCSASSSTMDMARIFSKASRTLWSRAIGKHEGCPLRRASISSGQSLSVI